MVVDAILYPCDEILKVPFHLHGDVVRVETAFMGIADDGRFAVVGSHDDEAIRAVENIQGSNVIVRLIGCSELQIVGTHKLGGNGLGCLQVDRVGNRAEKQPENGDA